MNAVSNSMTDEEINKVYANVSAYYKEISDHNTTLINSFGKTANRHFKNLLDFCDVTEKIELVDKPNGDKQNESYGMFKNVYVDQWCTNMEGDSFSGFIYANVKGQWIKIPFSC